MPTAVGLIVVTAAVIGALAEPTGSSSAPSFSDAPRSERRGGGIARADIPVGVADGVVPEGDVPVSEAGRVVTEADGVLPDGVTVFDDEYPGIFNLEPALLQALREATSDAAADGIEMRVNSGWRSREYQEQLRRDAVSAYGSEEEAARWVATANTSTHVAGRAVDIGPSMATAWLSEHGADYGLCQIYRNESWHYELRVEAIGSGCPRMAAGPTQGPGMQH